MEIVDILQYSVLGAVALIAAIIDGKTRKIPNWLVLILIILWIGFATYRSFCLDQLFYIFTCLLTGIGLFLLMLLLLYLMKDKNAFGIGDIKYLSVVGLYLGFYSACICIISSCVAFVIYSLISKKRVAAFAPFILVGIIISAIIHMLS
ncbi:MAG: prepilin peptidase [Coriobacteriia bacterium]|nr:prepilin peptidase [Coriobacteriia bacterium]